MTLDAGIYRITNYFYSITVDLNGGRSDDGTPITAWSNNKGMNQAWFLRPIKSGSDTYTIQNVGSGTYMDLSGGSSADGTPIIGYHKNGAANQQWVIRKASGGFYKIQNHKAETFLDLYNGGTANGTKITGWEGNWNGGGHQGWSFTRISISAGDVHTLLKNNQYLQQDFKSYVSDSPYLVLTQDQLNEIWRSTGLGDTKWRSEIFDCDDFALTFKTAVAAWGNKNIKADGFAILCGIMYGTNQGGQSHAYNWYIVEGALASIVFFEPQNGKTNYYPWGYNAYFGLF